MFEAPLKFQNIFQIAEAREHDVGYISVPSIWMNICGLFILELMAMSVL